MNNIQSKRAITGCLVFLLMLYAEVTLAAGRVAPFVGSTFDGDPCKGYSKPTTGPWDYTMRGSFPAELRLIEKHHFNKNVEKLKKGQTSVTPEEDLYFVLRHWPNHHRALNSISIYGKKLRSRGKHLKIPAECWLQRGVNYSSKDATVIMLYAIYLHRSGYNEKAHQQYMHAEELAPRNAVVAYNHGLLLVEMKDYKAAESRAQLAYSLGFPLPGLRKQLEAVGYLKE